MRKITLSEYNSIPEAWRGIWTTERWDLPDWAGMRERHMGKRTLKSWMTAHGKSRKKSRRKSAKAIWNTVRERGMNRISWIAPYDGMTPWKPKRQESPWTWSRIRKRTMRFSSAAIPLTVCNRWPTKAGKISSWPDVTASASMKNYCNNLKTTGYDNQMPGTLRHHGRPDESLSKILEPLHG